jgi:pimeloyl-ACP methyl ester carboxylesterase
MAFARQFLFGSAVPMRGWTCSATKATSRCIPTFKLFPQAKPPFLAVWGKHDPFFLPAGAEAFKRDIPGAEVRFFDTGHFALETHCEEIAAAIREFLSRSK